MKLAKPLSSAALALTFLLLAGPAQAQTGSIQGTVVDSTDGGPLPGVNVVIEGTQQGASTGADGTYEILGLEPGAYTVRASFVGYTPKLVTDVQVSTGEATQVDIALSSGAVQLDEVVAVGYGVQRREDVTGSVSSVDVDETDIGLTSSPQELIQGRAAGVTVLKNNGEPGGGVTVRIRGGTSINASNDPLYVIDGVPIDGGAVTPGGQGVGGTASGARNPLSLLNPNDIETIDILKDASATAIYGARGANGVVLITTKGGEAGAVSIDYSGSLSSSSPANTLDVLSGEEYRSFVEEQIEAGNIGVDDDGNVIDEDGDGTPDRLQSLGSANTDWQDAVLRTSVSQRHSLAFSGGSDATQYRASLSYENQEGVVISSGQEKITGRVNADHTTFDGRLNLNLNLTTSYIEDDYILFNETGGFEGALFTNVFAFNPTNPVEIDGDFFEIGAGAQSVRNPVAIAREIEDEARTTRTLANLSADVQIYGGLSAKGTVGVERGSGVRDIYFPRSNPIGALNNGEAFKREKSRSSALGELTANYNGLVAGDHSINAVAGYSYQLWINDEFGANARNFISDLTRYNNLGGSGDRDVLPYSGKSENRLISFFGRLNYDFDNRYLASFSLRRDGSSRFGANDEWGLFPAASVAWRVSNESFFPSAGAFTDLKLRGGYGVVGSQDFSGTNFNPNYPDLELLAPGFTAYFGGDQEFQGVAPIQFANPDITWEETATYNVGLDYGFLGGRLRGAMDFYVKDTENLLLEVDVPQPAVVPTQLQNIGSVRNTGFEFSLEALAVDREDLTVSVNANFSTNKNEVLDIGEKEKIITGLVSGAGLSDTKSQIIKPGLAIGTFIGPEFVEVSDGKQVFNNYIDEDGDGLGDVIDESEPTTTSPGQEDRRILGNAQPDFEYGINTSVSYRSFDLGIFLRGVQGRDLLNNTALEYTSKFLVNTNKNFLADALEGVDEQIAFEESSPIYSSRWVQDASFLRLEYVSLGYALSGGILPSQVSRARIYVRGNNLFVLTPYDGYDPEVNTGATGTGSIGIDYLNYPKPRTFTVGVDLGF